MVESPLALLRSIFKSWWIGLAAAGAILLAFINGYAGVQDQFGWLPKLQDVVAVPHLGFLPWWGWLFVWLLVLVSIFVYALFEYVRRNLPAASPQATTPVSDLECLRSEIGTVKSQAEQALSAHCTLQNSDSAKTSRAIAALEEATSEALANIEDIQRQIKIDMPNASTVCEAFLNLDQATDQRIRRIEDDVSGAKTLINSAHMESINLLYFAMSVVTRNILAGFLKVKPPFDKLSPPTDDRTRNDLMGEMRIWVQHVREIAGSAPFGMEIDLAIRTASQEGSIQFRQIPEPERPNSIDPLISHDFFVFAYQCEKTAECLEYVIRELERSDRQSLERLREFYTTRTKKA